MEHKRIWIERDAECPYFYTEEELADAAPPLVEYRIASSDGATVWRYIRPIAGTDPTIGYTENESLAREYEKFGPVDPLFPVERIAELERELAAIKGQEPVAEVRLVSEQRLVSGADMGLGCSDGYVTDRHLKLRFINYRMHNPDNGVIKDGTKLYAQPVAPVADKDAERPVVKDSLIAADLADQKDAARWRYFKYCFDHPMERRELARRLGCRDEEFDPDLDAAIDAAMAKGE